MEVGLLNVHEEAYNNLLRYHSRSLIAQDGKTLTDIVFHVRDSATSLALLPFYALYCRSAKEFLKVKDDENDIVEEVKDLRNGLKVFTGRYAKGRDVAFESDARQNEAFKNQLRFSFLHEFNFHLNLGVYFNRRGKIVFDTQLANFYLNIPERKAISDNEHALIVGENLGKEIANILVNFCGIVNLSENTTLFGSVPEYGYIDFNTNRKNRFFNSMYDKETNLVLLHMLSTIGFVNNLLVPIFAEKNVWLLRVVYIAVHNALLGMRKMKRHFEQIGNDFFLKPFVCNSSNLLSVPFRNCMMHYDLVNKQNQPVIQPKWHDPDKQFYGLVESCFDGLSFEQYFTNLYAFSQMVEGNLLSYFHVNLDDVNWDWD